MKLAETKKNYAELAEKYKLPSFKELNEDFEIFKVGKDEDCLIRSVRKVMMEKVVNSLGFVEMLLNPMNAPRIYMNYLKTMSQSDKKEIENIYNKLGELVVLSLEREIFYSEKEEAELIKKIHKGWNETRPSFKVILAHVKNPEAESVKRDKSYFG